MWEFYLAGSEVAFRNEYQIVLHIQITKNQEAAPLTRDYITDGGGGVVARQQKTGKRDIIRLIFSPRCYQTVCRKSVGSCYAKPMKAN